MLIIKLSTIQTRKSIGSSGLNLAEANILNNREIQGHIFLKVMIKGSLLSYGIEGLGYLKGLNLM